MWSTVFVLESYWDPADGACLAMLLVQLTSSSENLGHCHCPCVSFLQRFNAAANGVQLAGSP